MRYRKKPVVIDAIQFTGSNLTEVAGYFPNMSYFKRPDGLHVFTLEGDHLASPGDWIIRGVKGEYYPCKPDIFEMTYEPAD